MKKAFIISDVHLTSVASPQTEAMLFLLKKAQEQCDLFIILGDLFDFWLGDGDYFRRKWQPLLDEFQKLKTSCRMIYFEGNHDLHLQKFWEHRMGVEVAAGPKLIDYGKTKIWAEHGDEINREDRDYLFLRWLLRTGPMTFLAHNLPSRVSAWIGDTASSASRQYTARLENNTTQIFRSYAAKLVERVDYDLLLTGHTHVADDYQFTAGGKTRRLINLGSWFDGPHYHTLDQSGNIERLSLGK